MGSITLHPDNEVDYQLLIELSKRLNLPFTTEKMLKLQRRKSFRRLRAQYTGN